LKKTLDEIKNINPTFFSILLWHLGKLEANFVYELLAFFPLFSFVNVNYESSIPASEIKY